MERNQYAATRVGQIIFEHLSESGLTYTELAGRIGVNGTKMKNLCAGRHYLPLELIEPIVEALEIEPENFTGVVLCQYGSECAVQYIAKVFGDARSARNTSSEGDPRDQSNKDALQESCIDLEPEAQNLNHIQGDAESKSGASQVDIDFWRILKRGFRTGLSDRGIAVGEKDLILALRFMLEEIETSGLHVVPWKPTSQQHQAIKEALEEKKRMSIRWVRTRTKQRWRYKAAVEAAPNWRHGYELDKKVEEEEPGE
ncbi:hypothetical protein HPDFL43_21814 [Hoeflea phototrophica DFL-43]|uniref:Uncharacterized protein n=1 Tax=Hoeflea phototrophica (strain DSM 17068 / NCIMB 14078 / DFL-43) TaxID=411684 RepID=A9DFM1_HOEPD|nr:helix-turn-helix transcriptional regulator [Hoeflea phototrophica]EDQ31792.2 hypothetical protein HPDFL43_21814 [Hoeflea phototrophica DFL-43]